MKTYEDETIVIYEYESGVATYSKITGLLISWEGSSTY